MSQKRSVRACVAGLVFACAVVGASSMTTQADSVVVAIRVGSGPRDVAINPAGTFAYVANNQSNSVSKINLATDTVDSTITVDGQPYGLAINPVGTFAYAAIGRTDGNFIKINLATDTVVATITVGATAYGVAINPAGTFAYVTNGGAGNCCVSKINLVNDVFVSYIRDVNTSGLFVAIDPAGTFAYVTDAFSRSVSKIALVATDPQSLTLTAGSTQLLGAKTFVLVATAQSNLPVAFSSVTPTVCTVSGSTVTMLTLGDCTINANQAGGSGWDAAPQVSKTFKILPSPPPGEAGVSIKNGDAYSNTKKVTLTLIWPNYATAVRISNDGGFEASKTQTKDLAASIDWELDDSVKGINTKVVYVRFNGVTDTTKTYSDDIILDTTAPVVKSAEAEAVSGSIDVTLKATDDITGVDKVQIQNGTKTVTENYDTKITVTEKELGLTISTSGVKKLASSSIKIRVSDKAGNWSSFQTLTVSGAVSAPAVSISKSTTARSIATFLKIPVTSTSKVSIKVVLSHAKYCKVSGMTLRGVKTGACKVTVTVTPKKGKATSRTVTLKVTK